MAVEHVMFPGVHTVQSFKCVIKKIVFLISSQFSGKTSHMEQNLTIRYQPPYKSFVKKTDIKLLQALVLLEFSPPDLLLAMVIKYIPDRVWTWTKSRELVFLDPDFQGYCIQIAQMPAFSIAGREGIPKNFGTDRGGPENSIPALQHSAKIQKVLECAVTYKS